MEGPAMTDQTHQLRLPVERWFAAIGQRLSRRAFSDEPLPADELEALADFCAAPGLFPAARSVLIREAPTDIFLASREDRAAMPAAEGRLVGITGSYGRIVGASSVLAFVGRVAGAAGSPAHEPAAEAAAAGSCDEGFSIEEQVGYTGEAAILEATAQGLDTCWVGGFFSPSLTARLIGARSDEKIFAITPVGHGAESLSRKERYLFRMGKPKKRRALEHIALGLATKDWPGWAIAGVRAVQLAPSAVNRQPWRFRQDGETIVLASDAPDSGIVSRRLDCGIAMLHFELGVLHFGRAGAWEPPRSGQRLDVARWRPGR
jgi:nitroreductase